MGQALKEGESSFFQAQIPPQGELTQRAHSKHLKIIIAGYLPQSEANPTQSEQHSKPSHQLKLVEIETTDDKAYAESIKNIRNREAQLTEEELLKARQELILEKMFKQDHIPVKPKDHELTPEEQIQYRRESAKYALAKAEMAEKLGGPIRDLVRNAPYFTDAFTVGAIPRSVFDRTLGALNAHRHSFQKRTGLTTREMTGIDTLIIEPDEVAAAIKKAKQQEKRQPIPRDHSVTVFQAPQSITGHRLAA